MTRPALSATRGIEILELLSTFPDRAFTLSGIVEATNINIASAHAILIALTEKGYLVRSAKQKTYQLGPSLIAAGYAAQRSLPIVHYATAAAHDLLDEFGFPVMLNTALGDELLALVSLPDASGRHAGMHVGERLPLMAPIGAPFLAWRDDEAVAQWIARRATPLDPKLLKALHADLALTRERGYHVASRPPDHRTIGSLMAQMSRSSSVSDYKNEVRRVIEAFTDDMCRPVELDPERIYDVRLIAAPLFDQGGQALYNLCLGELPAGVKGSELLRYADRLTQKCLELMRRDRSMGRWQG